MKKVILLRSGQKKEIKKTLNCTYPTIASALKGESNTLLAQRIRAEAIRLGGVEYEIKENV